MATQLCDTIQSQGLPRPSEGWVTGLIQSRNPALPFPALVATAKSRLLGSDWAAAGILDGSTAGFPPNMASVHVEQTRLSSDVFSQVLDVENLSKSRWEQVEELEAIERGEQTRGREIIRLPSNTDDSANMGSSEATQSTGQAQRGAQASTNKNNTHRLVLQDCKGQTVYGIELRRVDKIGVGSTTIGEKVVMKAGTIVARGTVLLEPCNCQLLGGKVDAWQKDWLEQRLARLKEAARVTSRQG